MLENNTKTAKTRIKVVVAGGGFAGVKAALELIEEPRIDVTLISDKPEFRYHPSLYRTATGGYRVQSLLSLKDIFESKPVNIVIDKAERLDRSNKKLITATGKRFAYDYLILALGSVTNYFGVKGLSRYSYGIKNYEEAIELKKHLHDLLIKENQPDINYFVVGGGPTGVELAGALPAYIKHLIKKHHIKKQSVKISLIEAAPRLLPSMPKDISMAVSRRLRREGVKIIPNKRVEGETIDSLVVDGKPLKSRTVIWTAGICNNPFFKNNKFDLDKRGLVQVNQYLEAEPNIYVLGDNANTRYTGMAQTAVRDADFAAHSIINRINSERDQAYTPKKPVYVMPAGKHWAAVLWGKLRLYGRMGWLFRRIADFMAYREVETWWEATEHWWAANIEEESCPFCAISNDEANTA